MSEYKHKFIYCHAHTGVVWRHERHGTGGIFVESQDDGTVRVRSKQESVPRQETDLTFTREEIVALIDALHQVIKDEQ